jgi:hypothetical protein
MQNDMLTCCEIPCDTMAQNVTVEWLPLLHMCEILSSTLTATTDCPLTFFCGFPQFHQANSGTVAQISSHLLPWTTFPIDCSLMILLNLIYYILTTNYFPLFQISTG